VDRLFATAVGTAGRRVDDLFDDAGTLRVQVTGNDADDVRLVYRMLSIDHETDRIAGFDTDLIAVSGYF
jgi:hypothetical protein